MQFVDVKNDIAFRKIFGNEKKKEILLSFLNAVLNLDETNSLVDISIINPYQLPILPNMKASIIDVKAKDVNNQTFIIEMQVAEVDGMDKRLLYYTSKEYSQQIDKGEKYTELNPVIFIGIFDFNFSSGEYLSHHAICNVKSGENLIKDMNFYFIELPKFSKQLSEIESIVDKWIYFIKEAENLAIIPENVDDKGLEEAYIYANKNTWSKDELSAYDYTSMREQDERGRMQLVERRAKESLLKAENKLKEAEESAKEAEYKLKQAEESAKEVENKLKEAEESAKEVENKLKEVENKLKQTEESIKQSNTTLKNRENEIVLNLIKENLSSETIGRLTGMTISEIDNLKSRH